jgi:hypothetical protein
VINREHYQKLQRMYALKGSDSDLFKAPPRPPRYYLDTPRPSLPY